MSSLFKDSLFVRHLSFFQIENFSSRLHLSDELCTRILETLHDIKMEIDSYQQGDVHVLRALLYEVLMLLDRAYLKMTSMEEGRSREVSNNHVSKFMNLVATHAKEQHSVQYYADKLCITPNYLNEMITSTMGFSAKQYIQGKVMEEAKRLLVYTQDVSGMTASSPNSICCQGSENASHITFHNSRRTAFPRRNHS